VNAQPLHPHGGVLVEPIRPVMGEILGVVSGVFRRSVRPPIVPRGESGSLSFVAPGGPRNPRVTYRFDRLRSRGNRSSGDEGDRILNLLVANQACEFNLSCMIEKVYKLKTGENWLKNSCGFPGIFADSSGF